ncbi:adenine-specific DNA-methyltransferase [Leptotrichia wadei]|uniref:Adenine-specific DNA-methyltransferase n=1 Tax=Leptotrichia wadei TaxID=157687 RepID=A0A510KW50_9FUSO|nr:site-specific DNA-methyltransferase [Leptotrichia wadei]BBM55846.1 adenine-specific DNA-methyltransferase [Leptotrichia wadei]
MENNKIKKEINDIVNDNLKALEQLFPSAVKDGQLDIKTLKEELGDFEEVTTEKYELNWSGKQNAKKVVQQGIGNKTLKFVAKDSKNAGSTENIYIEGDNLEVLKLLRQNYYNSIKMIYIDPPYNTGNDFVYNDTFKMDKEESDKAEGIISENNEKLQKNQKSTNRYHANWLNMMYPRLKLARDLLTDDGVIFISIDDNEIDNLMKICEELFNRKNLEIFVWKKKGGAGNTEKVIGVLTEYLICCFKDKKPGNFNYQKIDRKYLYNDEKGMYNLEGIEKTNLGIYERKTMKFGIIDPKTEITFFPAENMRWTLGYEKIQNLIKENKLFFDYKNKKVKLIKREDDYETSENVYYNLFDKEGSLSTAKKNLEKFLGNKEIFDTPKPVELLKKILQIASKKNSIILDFFSGSATTAHAVMQLNSEDNGNRKYIMVQLPETTDEKSEAFKAGYKNIAEIGKERIRRAGEKIKQEIEEYNSNLKLGEEPKKVPDIGFKVFKVDDTNIKWYDLENFNEESQYSFDDPDSLDFVLGSNDIDIVYEIMLRQNDIPLSERLEVLTDIGNRTYFYASTYLICLETEITEEMVEKLASLDPLPIKFVFRDSAFKDNISLKDETFRKLRSLIERNSGESKVSYRVEFI